MPFAPITTTSQDYLDGLADGQAGKDPDSDRLAYGWNRLNDYERGYIDSGKPETAALLSQRRTGD